jgi:hypothetical protein
MILDAASVITLQRIAGREIRRRSIAGDKDITAPIRSYAAALIS